MENYSYSSYADSHDSSPRSRDNESWDDQQPPPSNYKVKFMCSYGGKILPRPHDNQLTYVGGETKILSVDRSTRFSNVISKLSSFVSDHNHEICFKYQLPGEDLDALISVTNDEDLDHMMSEYDRIYRSAGSRPARLRIFLFPITSSDSNSNQSSLSFSGDGDSSKPTQQWFVDALNSVPIQSLDASSPTANVSNADFLFGLEQQHQQQKQHVSTPKSEFETKIAIGSDSDRSTGGDSVYEMQRQIHELQRLQISNQEQQQQQQQHQQAQAAMFQRKNEAANLNLPRTYHGEYYMTEKPAPIPPATYWQHDRQSAFPGVQIAGTERQQQQQVYMLPSQPQATAMYQAPAASVRQFAGQGGYGMQRVVPDVYREQPVYTMGPPQTQLQPQPQPQPHVAKMVMGEVGGGYPTQVAYDSNGRQVYYTTVAAVPSPYPTAVTTVNVDPRQSGALNQEGKVVKPPQVS